MSPIKPHWTQDGNAIYQGHVSEVLRGMDPESVQMCVTSPPYWGLRDYDLEPQVWGGRPDCPHRWGERLAAAKRSNTNEDFAEYNREHFRGGGHKAVEQSQNRPDNSGQFCQLCGAWRGSLGLEPNPDLYITHIVEIFREVRRVLRKDGTLWLNMGDSYSAGTRAWNSFRRDRAHVCVPHIQEGCGLKPKNLIGIPWRVALALQADGWWLRCDVIWSKPNPMPESVADRPAKSHDYLFLLSKSPRYFYDADAIKEAQSENTHARHSKDVESGLRSPPAAKENSKEINRPGFDKWRECSPKTFTGSRNKRTVWTIAEERDPLLSYLLMQMASNNPEELQRYLDEYAGGKSLKRDVWTIPTQPVKEAHFATYPEKLVEPCILAGTSERGCCPDCGAPWERVVEKREPGLRDVEGDYPGEQTLTTKKYKHGDGAPGFKTIGWVPGCKCYKTLPFPKYPRKNKCISDEAHEILLEPIRKQREYLLKLWKPLKTTPCVVFDPFGGAMTTAVVSHKHGRKFVMIELSKVYIDEIGVPRIERGTIQRGLF